EPGATHRARRRGVLSLRQVSLHKQRKVARAVTARRLLILISAKPNSRRAKTRPTGCGEERVGDVAPTYGASCGAARRARRGVAPTYGERLDAWLARRTEFAAHDAFRHHAAHRQHGKQA